MNPLAQLLHKQKSNTDNKGDGFKIALAIEGGEGAWMCLYAGMVAAIYFLGLEDCFDVVYGSSTEPLTGAYFITVVNYSTDNKEYKETLQGHNSRD